MNKLGAISGVIWGLLGTLMGYGIFGKPALAGLLASPLIGMVIVRVVPFWSKQNKLFRILIAYSSLIFAAAMFGFIVGVADMMFGVPGRIPWAVAMQGISICVGGILILNFYLIGIIFWPLSYIGFMILNASLLKTERY